MHIAHLHLSPGVLSIRRSLVGTASTVRELSSRIMSSAPSRYTAFVIVCGTCRDNSILALFVAHDFSGVRISSNSGTGKSRKIIDVASSTLEFEKKRALIGMHAISGNDYISSFFRKVR